jgi:hypothetical protein
LASARCTTEESFTEKKKTDAVLNPEGGLLEDLTHEDLEILLT